MRPVRVTGAPGGEQSTAPPRTSTRHRAPVAVRPRSDACDAAVLAANTTAAAAWFLYSARMSSLQANFESLPLDELVVFLAANRSTGVLEVGGDQPCSVWFVDGAVTSAARPDDVEIGDALVRAGVVSVTGWSAVQASTDPSVALARTPGIDASRVRSALQERMIDALFPLFLQPETAYDFHEGRTSGFGAAFAWDGRELAAQARARLGEWRAIADGIPSLEAVVELDPYLPDGSDAITIPPGEWAVVARVDGRRTVVDIVQLSGLTAFEVCSTLLRLQGAGVVRLTDPSVG